MDGIGDACDPEIGPVAHFTFTPEKPVVDEILTFNASGSYDPDGTIVSYEWDFGDDGVTTTTEKLIAHSYVLAGDYSVNLRVTDNDRLTDTTSRNVTVSIYGYGDLNGDGNITTADAVIALEIAARGEWDADADVNGDGRITSLDALMILQVAAGRLEL